MGGSGLSALGVATVDIRLGLDCGARRERGRRAARNGAAEVGGLALACGSGAPLARVPQDPPDRGSALPGGCWCGGSILGPGSLTRNPYAGVRQSSHRWWRPSRSVPTAVIVAGLAGAAHVAGRAAALLRDSARPQDSNPFGAAPEPALGGAWWTASRR